MIQLNDTPHTIGPLNRLPIGLLVLRLVLAAYLVQWGLLHWRYPDGAIEVYARWYGVAPTLFVSSWIGMALIFASALMACGFCRRIGYGAGVLFQGLMVLGLTPHLLDPYGYHLPPNWINHGLIAQVPVLAGYWALFALRKTDRYSLDFLVEKKRGSDLSGWSVPAAGEAGTAQALIIIRLTSALFFFQWGVEKFVETEMSIGMMERWYGVGSFQMAATYATGAFEILLAAALATGTCRRLTYGIGALVKAKTCWAIAPLLLFPFATESGGRLSSVAASVPVLGVLCFLYWCRGWDTLSFDSRFRKINRSAPEKVLSH